MYTSIDELQQAVTGVLRLDGNTPRVTGEQTLREKIIDDLVFTAMFAADQALKAKARSLIRQLAEALGIRSSSMHHYYLAIGKGEVPTTTTVPAINIRTLTYDIARVLFKLKRELSIGPLIVEIARSEMGYTYQRPDDYAVAVLAAAIKEGYSGPGFLQGNHAQWNARRYREDPAAETLQMKRLIQETIDADFHNIDIDASTLVDLSKATLDEQHAENHRVTAALPEYIRSLDTKRSLSVGAEIGHIGGQQYNRDGLRTCYFGPNTKHRDRAPVQTT